MSLRWGLFSFPVLAMAAGAAACSASPGPAPSGPSTKNNETATSGDAGSKGAEAGPSTAANGCPVDSGYLGDSMCLPAPDPSQGFQLHYGPTDYANPTDVAPFLLQPSGEIVDCLYEKTPNTKDVYVGGYEFYMRPGSHHLNMNVNPQPQADGFAICQANDQSPGLLGGSETPKVDQRIDPAPENQGLAVYLPANSQAVINFHVIDTTAHPILREAWLNYYYMDPSQVKGLRGNVFLVGGLGFQITPGTHQTYTYACTPDRPTRILSLAAHMHVHATRMSAWKVTAGQPSLVYETYDWSTPSELRYDSVTTNPAADPSTQTPGGSSGTLVLQPGDTLQWECEVNNTSNVTLTFKNEVYTGEMCIMTGTMVPADNPMNPYNFVCNKN